ncbi:unnamed protein product [Orchesella dallaii]|uniref:GRAM domain-containing protein n=1 Tax=Orchesella dallaii TaxID=48710 RepID=A0ABP1QUQ5_9HEXA
MEDQINSNSKFEVPNSNNNGPNPSNAPGSSSPFELRRHQSYYDSSTSKDKGKLANRRASSTKIPSGSVGMNKTKSSNQILNFFRSQSHEPKGVLAGGVSNINANEGSAATSSVNNTNLGATDSVATSNVSARPRPRPQSLYTKTTSSKGVFQHRVSGIETTPETPEVAPELRVGDSDSSSSGGGSNNGNVGLYPMSGKNSPGDINHSHRGHEEGGFYESGTSPDDNQSRDTLPSGGNSSSRSSVSSSDSFASCEIGTATVIRKASSNNPSGSGSHIGRVRFTTKDEIEEENSNEDRQSLKHLSVSAPAMRTSSTKSADGSDTGLPPMTTSKSRQKKFHRHFKTVPPDEKVLDYYSCALVADILLQGFLYITENYFAFYSNVFGYVTKVLIPVCSVVRITKERTAKIFPNAVGVCTRTEKHVFASLISRDTTFKLMCKVWNYSIEQEAEEIRALQRRVAAQVEAEDAFSADVPVPDESSGDSGSGNDSAIEPSSHSPSPQNTPGIEKLVHAKSTITGIPSHLTGTATVALVTGAHGEEKSITLAGGKLVEESTVPILTYRGTHHIRTSISTASTNPNLHSASNAHHLRSPQQTGRFSVVRKIGSNVGGRGPSLLLVATALLVILFMSAALLLSRISNLQQKLMERPVIHDSEQFYQELLSWQTKLHSTTGEEIHQYINSNLQQIVKVRESLEALSMLFVNRPQGAPGLGEPHPSTIMGGESDHHHHHHHHSHQDS